MEFDEERHRAAGQRRCAAAPQARLASDTRPGEAAEGRGEGRAGGSLQACRRQGRQVGLAVVGGLVGLTAGSAAVSSARRRRRGERRRVASRPLAEPVIVDASVRARLFGIRLLSVDARVVVSPHRSSTGRATAGLSVGASPKLRACSAKGAASLEAARGEALRGRAPNGRRGRQARPARRGVGRRAAPRAPLDGGPARAAPEFPHARCSGTGMPEEAPAKGRSAHG